MTPNINSDRQEKGNFRVKGIGGQRRVQDRGRTLRGDNCQVPRGVQTHFQPFRHGYVCSYRCALCGERGIVGRDCRGASKKLDEEMGAPRKTRESSATESLRRDEIQMR